MHLNELLDENNSVPMGKANKTTATEGKNSPRIFESQQAQELEPETRHIYETTGNAEKEGDVKYIQRFTYIHPGRWMGFPYDVWNCCFTDALICPQLQPKHVRKSEIISNSTKNPDVPPFIINEFRSSISHAEISKLKRNAERRMQMKTQSSTSSFDDTGSPPKGGTGTGTGTRGQLLFRGGEYRGIVSQSNVNGSPMASTLPARRNSSHVRSKSASASPNKRSYHASTANHLNFEKLANTSRDDISLPIPSPSPRVNHRHNRSTGFINESMPISSPLPVKVFSKL
jgi:hypothetical protein